MKESLKTIESFRKYCNTYWLPEYLRDYVKLLNQEELVWFYNQVKEALSYLTTEAYLIYKFKWIVQRTFTDLTKEIYLESLYNPEIFYFDIIKPKSEKELEKKYENDNDVRRFYHQI